MTTRSNLFAATFVVGTSFCGVFVACSSPFDSCEARRTCPPKGGEGGQAFGEGGDAATPGGTAGHAPVVEPMAGQAGEDAGSVGGAGSGSPEQSAGAGGSSSLPEGVTLDAPCSENAALACAGEAQKLSLICRGGRWQPNETCSGDENCDRETGACAPISPECEERIPGETFCDADTLVKCGPDLVSVEMMACAGGCRDEGDASVCVPAGCGDGKIQAPETCDDGNAASDDGCSAQCTIEIVGLGVGNYHACALGGNGVVKCWGGNEFGQLGLGDTQSRGDQRGELGASLPAVDLGSGRTAKAIAVGEWSTCAILDDGTLKCWGPARGLGDVEVRGDEPGEMGDALPRVDLGTGRSAKRVSVGGSNACAILDNDGVKCWGTNGARLGLGDSEPRGDEPGEMGDALPYVNLGLPNVVTALSVGYTNSCAILSSGSLLCWGQNIIDDSTYGDEPGEMGFALPTLDVGAGRTSKAIEVAHAATCAILDDNSLKCWNYIDGQALYPASGDERPLVNLGAGRHAISVDAGFYELCALLDDGSVKCWAADVARLGGYGAFGAAQPPAPIDLGTNRKARRLAVGANGNVCVALDDNSVRCWGNNDVGQLGVGDTEPRGRTVDDRGDALRPVDLVF